MDSFAFAFSALNLPLSGKIKGNWSVAGQQHAEGQAALFQNEYAIGRRIKMPLRETD